MNLWTKLIIAFLMVSLFPLAYLGKQTVDLFERVLNRQIEEFHRGVAQLVAKETFQTLTMARQGLAAIAEVEELKSYQPEKCLRILKGFGKEFPIFKCLYMISRNKEVIACTNLEGFTRDKTIAWSQVQGAMYKGNLNFSEKTGRPSIRLELFVIDHDEYPGAVLGGELDLGYVTENLQKLQLKNNSIAYAVTDNGEIIAASDPKAPPVQWPEEFFLKGINDKRISRGGEEFVIGQFPLKQFEPYKAPNWFIVIEQPVRDAFAEALALAGTVNQMTALTIILAILVGLIFGRSLTRSIERLVSHAKTISSGNLGQPIQRQSADEIGDLAENFEQMRLSLDRTQRELADKIKQLSTLNEVGRAISSILNFEELMNIILKITTGLLHAERGSLMLLNDDETHLTIQASQGLNETTIAEFRGKVGDPVAGWVLKREIPLLIKDAANDPLFTELKKGGTIGSGSLMCVPLRAKDKVLGVINIRHPETHFFNEENFDFFRHLAMQAAIAIENARLYRYAVTDEMTRLYNHRYFQLRLSEELQRADRFNSAVSLLITDVDKFKVFNDTYGHQEGDRVLKIVARAMQEMVRDIDIVCRYGGEEFCVICPEKDGQEAMVPAERIRKAVEELEFMINDKRVPITISIGIACYPTMAKDKMELIKKADTALYHSKHSGRNRCTLWRENMGVNEDG